MAGHQFLAPRSVSDSHPRQRFTVEQANKTLPLVRRVVADIVRTHEQVSEFQQRLELAKAAEQPAIQDQLQRSLEHLQDYLDELTEIGCELKDYRLGLIDFIGQHQGRDICLCWKLGEPTVAFWHELHTGFAGRQPISMLGQKD